MRESVLGYEGLRPELARGALEQALRGGGDVAEVFVEERYSLSMRLEDGRIESAASVKDLGSSIRLVSGLSTAFGYVDSAEESDTLQLADDLARGAKTSAKDISVLSLSGTARGGDVIVDPQTVDATAKARLLHLADEAARGSGADVKQVTAVYVETLQRIWVASSEDVFASDDRTRVLLGITVLAERGGVIQTGHDTLAHHGGLELLDEGSVSGLARTAAQRALTLLGGKAAPTGRMPVVLGNGFGGVLFHEACGHGLEADYVLKKSSVWEGKIGQRVAAPHLYAYDDGMSPGMWGSGGCDDEGTPCQRTPLIEAGVLTGYLTDGVRARALGMELTGNGRREDYRSLPYPRMTNTYFGPGGARVGELIGNTKNGLYAKSLSGGEVNPTTGDFVFAVEEGYLIERGNIASPVRGATLVGNGPEILQAIDAVADDLDVKAGMCGKEGQRVPVGSGQPTVRIREMTVGGTSV